MTLNLHLPSRLAVVLGTLVAGGMAISSEVHMSHPLHQAFLLLGGALLFLIHPEETGHLPGG